MEKTFKSVVLLLLVVMLLAGCSYLVQTNTTTETAPETYSIHITQTDCLVQIRDSNQRPVAELTEGVRYVIYVDVATLYYVSEITMNDEPISLPYAFTASEDVYICATASECVIRPQEPTPLG